MRTTEDAAQTVGRYALATRDGKTIHEHFGHVTQFLVVDLLSTGNIAIEGWRDCEPTCTPEDDEGTGDLRAIVAEKLRDCTAIYVARIGIGAAEDMKRRGVKVEARPGFISEVLAEVFMQWKGQRGGPPTA